MCVDSVASVLLVKTGVTREAGGKLSLCNCASSFSETARSSPKFEKVCIAEDSRLGSLMTSDSWTENTWRFFNSWSPKLPKAPQAKLLHQAESRFSLKSRKSLHLCELTCWWGRWLPLMVTPGGTKTKLPNPIFLNSSVAGQSLLEKEHVHHSTSCYQHSQWV